MKIILSGFNLDIETIKELRGFIRTVVDQLEPSSFSRADPVTKDKTIQQLYKQAAELLARDNLTPETLSAAYARISRNPKPVNELREIARREVDRARKSNQNIIFGLGHSSVAEHATFNFDIIGVSRLAVETIEHFRLASYTEKSQRYILFKDDFVIPEEIRGSNLVEDYINLHQEQNSVYFKLYDILKPYFFETHKELAQDKKNHRTLDGLAKEDARYIISLATQTQLGMTVNARALENIIAKCNSHYLSEIKEYGSKLYEAAKIYTPSIVKYAKPTDYLRHKKDGLSSFISQHLKYATLLTADDEAEVRLIDYPEDIDNRILAAILFRYSGLNFEHSLTKIKAMSSKEKELFYQEVYRNINPWDSVIREFEFIYFTFELIISASNYGQLKRHRMANITAQDYDINLGVKIPKSIIQTHQKKVFLQTIDKTNSFYMKLSKSFPEVAPYVLTNAHRRRVLFKINMRELYHFSRLREDQHAQWDIRETAEKIHQAVIDKAKYAGALLGGKDKFHEHHKLFYYG